MKQEQVAAAAKHSNINAQYNALNNVSLILVVPNLSDSFAVTICCDYFAY